MLIYMNKAIKWGLGIGPNLQSPIPIIMIENILI